MSSNSISKKEIEELAYKISQDHRSYDQNVWKLAEISIMLERGKDIDRTMLSSLAKSINEQNSSLKMIHWLIAERTLLYRKKFPDS
jgi:hypothetical protein